MLNTVASLVLLPLLGVIVLEIIKLLVPLLGIRSKTTFDSTGGSNNNAVREGLYEVRPGKHKLRMLMLKEGNGWTVIKLLHHDEVQRTIENI